MKLKQKTLKCLCLMVLVTLGMILAGGVWAGSDPSAHSKNANVLSTGGDTSLAFSVGIGAGYMTGEATEIVYWPDVGNHKASELTWKIDQLFMFGVNAEVEIQNWIKVKLDTWFKVKDGEGTMDDYDWQVVGGAWTDWSHHEDTDVTEAYIFDLSSEFVFQKSEKGHFSAIIGYKVDNFGWESRGGDYIYSVAGFHDRQGSFADGQLGISYEQTFRSPYFGIGTALNFLNFKTEARIIYAPYVYGEATDHHYLRDLVTDQTFDEYGEGDMVALDISGTYSFADNWSLGVGLKYQSYSAMIGDAKWINRRDGTVDYSGDGVGMDQTSTMFTTTLKYIF